jgi:hypothetical protein
LDRRRQPAACAARRRRRLRADRPWQGGAAAAHGGRRLGGFLPFRRDVDYRPATEAPIAPLIEALDFIPDKKRWGYPFRRGILAIGAADFARIAAATRVEGID